MLSKLCIYDLKTSLRQISIVWAALLASSLMLSFSMRFLFSAEVDNGRISSIIGIVLSILYVVIFAATVISTVILVVMRFYNGVCGDEGYLTHTLPVTTRSIIMSKGIVASLIVITSCIVAAVSVALILLIADLMSVDLFMINVRRFTAQNPGIIGVYVEGIIFGIIYVIKSIYQIYASIAIGQTSNSHKALLAVVAYIAINMILNFISVGTMVFLNLSVMDTATEWISLLLFGNATGIEAIGRILAIGIVSQGILILIFHVITEYLLKNKLNLQ